MICPSHTAGKAATLKAGLAGPRASARPHHPSAATQQGKQGLVPVAAAKLGGSRKALEGKVGRVPEGGTLGSVVQQVPCT